MLVTQLCLTLWDPMDYRPPGSSVHGVFSRQEYWSGLPFPSPGEANVNSEEMASGVRTDASWIDVGANNKKLLG